MTEQVRDQLASMPSATPLFFAGRVVTLTEDGRTSAIAKSAVAGPWTITPTGLVGDEQADVESHGGPEKALHQYPYDHYPAWRAEIGAHTRLEGPGGFGENLSTSGWTEATVHIGDVVQLGEVVLQISQGRQPCWKLNVHFARKKMALDVQTSGRTGWYFRVLQPGTVRPGDTMRVTERPCPDWPLRRMTDLLYKRVDDQPSLEAMADLHLLAEDWRKIARKRLASRRTEDWTRRLTGVKP